jgi:glycosyltransferase involved in cell wall biosynthesis
MILLFHTENKVTEVIVDNATVSKTYSGNKAVLVFIELTSLYPDKLLIWCRNDLKTKVDFNGIERFFENNYSMVSIPETGNALDKRIIGYIENSPFIKANDAVTYPTWLMNSDLGGIHTSSISKSVHQLNVDNDFDYFLCSIAKRGMPNGLFCYQSSLIQQDDKTKKKSSNRLTFRFVKQHYKTRWVLLLFALCLLFEKRFLISSLLLSLVYRKRKPLEIKIGLIENDSKTKHFFNLFDVLIPTIGRKPFLYDFLNDLRNQTVLPKIVIIVEQNPESNSESELDFLSTEDWPFKIKHIFIHQTGACQARNIGLDEVSSEWVFLADDDIRVSNDFFQQISSNISETTGKAFTISCLQPNEKEQIRKVVQWNTFGSGCSLVKSKFVKNIRFDTAFEHGFGEDADFGMQLRNKGVDIIYLPEPSILHLKAPVGGFRTKPVLPWLQETITPKPAPSIMLFQLKHRTKEQLLGYKVLLFLKYYRKQNIKNPFKYLKNFKQRWNKSVFWAEKLAENDVRY